MCKYKPSLTKTDTFYVVALLNRTENRTVVVVVATEVPYFF